MARGVEGPGHERDDKALLMNDGCMVGVLTGHQSL